MSTARGRGGPPPSTARERAANLAPGGGSLGVAPVGAEVRP